MRTYRIAAIPRDGRGKEVVAAGLEVLLASAERDGRFTLDLCVSNGAPSATRKWACIGRGVELESAGMLPPSNG